MSKHINNKQISHKKGEAETAQSLRTQKLNMNIICDTLREGTSL